MVRHRPVRPRRLLAHRLWRPRVADRRSLGRRLLEPAGAGPRPRLRLLPQGRWPRHAGHGRADGDPLDPARHRPHHPDAPRPRHRDRGHRHSRGAEGRARGARRRALHPLAALHRKRHRRRHEECQASDAPRAAQHPGAADRAIDLRVRLGHADRGGPELPGRRRAAGSAELGQHHRPGPHLLPDRAVDHPDPRHVPRHHRSGGEPSGRRAARPARSAAGQKL